MTNLCVQGISGKDDWGEVGRSTMFCERTLSEPDSYMLLYSLIFCGNLEKLTDANNRDVQADVVGQVTCDNNYVYIPAEIKRADVTKNMLKELIWQKLNKINCTVTDKVKRNSSTTAKNSDSGVKIMIRIPRSEMVKTEELPN